MKGVSTAPQPLAGLEEGGPDREYQRLEDETPHPPRTSKETSCCQATKSCFAKRIPALQWLPVYNARENLVSDIIGGVTIGMVCLAQTLAHAAIATTENIQGPYCAFVPTLIYAFLGTSPHASVSSGAIAAILIADQLRPWPDIKDRTELASLLAFISGIALLIMGSCKMAFAVRFLSHPTLSGFITGGSILIIVQQTRNLFGFRSFPHTDGFISHIITTAQHLSEVDPVSLCLGLVLILMLDQFNRLKAYANKQIKKGGASAKKFQIVKRMTEMKEIVVAVTGVMFGYFTAEGGPGGDPILVTVGHIPAGLPSFQAPWDIPAYQGLVNHHSRLSSFIMGGVLVALTSFLTTYATTKKMALHYGYQLDASQEMIALGMAGIGGSFFRAFTPSGSLSRTGLAADCGVKTQLGGVAAAGVIGLGLVYLTPTLKYLPKAALAAIIMKSTSSLVDFATPKKLMKSWKPKKQGGLRRDMVIWCVAFIFTLCLGVVYGIGFAVLISIFLIVADAAEPQAVELGRVEALGRRWRNIEDWPNAHTYPGILVFEFRGPLAFASSEFFQEEIERRHFDKEQRDGVKLSIVVLSFESVHHLDSTALAMLEDLLNEWRQKGISCIVSGARHQVRKLIEEKLVRLRKEAKQPAILDQTGFMISVTDAVDLARKRLAARQEHGGKEAQEVAQKERSNSATVVQRFLRRKSKEVNSHLAELPPEVREAARLEVLKRPKGLERKRSLR